MTDRFFHRPDTLRPDRALLLIVDVQTRLLPAIADHETVIAQSVRAIRAAELLGLPIIISEQYPQGLGHTDPRLLEAAKSANPHHIEKSTFSVAQDAAAWDLLRTAERPQIILIGIETHVCVQQTALDLLARGLTPVLLADAVGSRRVYDRDVALRRMQTAGAIVTTMESAFFELTYDSATDRFKRLLAIVK